jgi:RNA polymerase sigma-70 factor (ECF subfamily)
MKKRLQPTDKKLMLKVQKGDVTAFETLYDRYHRRLYHFILRFIGEKSLAEDILQETFLHIFKERKTYKKTARFSTFIFTIARNLCLDALKKWETKQVLGGQDDVIEKAMDHSDGPSMMLEEAGLGEMVRRAIQTLPGDQREVLILSKYSGLTHEEIGRIVGSTPTAVKQKVYRAMLSLKQKLKK